MNWDDGGKPRITVVIVDKCGCTGIVESWNLWMNEVRIPHSSNDINSHRTVCFSAEVLLDTSAIRLFPKVKKALLCVCDRQEVSYLGSRCDQWAIVCPFFYRHCPTLVFLLEHENVGFLLRVATSVKLLVTLVMLHTVLNTFHIFY